MRVGTRLRSATGTRCFPHNRWRKKLGEGAVRGREHGLFGYGHGPKQSPYFVCWNVATGDPYIWPDERRTRQRIIPVQRRRRDVETIRGARIAETAGREDCGARGATRLQPGLCFV